MILASEASTPRPDRSGDDRSSERRSSHSSFCVRPLMASCLSTSNFPFNACGPVPLSSLNTWPLHNVAQVLASETTALGPDSRSMASARLPRASASRAPNAAMLPIETRVLRKFRARFPLVLDLYSQTLHQTDFFFSRVGDLGGLGCAASRCDPPSPARGTLGPAVPLVQREPLSPLLWTGFEAKLRAIDRR